MSDREPVLRDCFKVKKGLCVTGDSNLSGNLTVTGDFALLNPNALLTVGNFMTDNLSAGRLSSSNIETIEVPFGPDYTIVHPLSVVDEIVFEDDVQIEDDLWVKGNLRVDGNAYLSAGVDGSISVGDANTDNVVFNADVNSDIIPDASDTYDLGTADQHWRTLYVHDVSAHGSIDVENSGTLGGNLSVSGTTTLVDDLSVRSDLYVDGAQIISGATNQCNDETYNVMESVFSDVSFIGHDWTSSSYHAPAWNQQATINNYNTELVDSLNPAGDEVIISTNYGGSPEKTANYINIQHKTPFVLTTNSTDIDVFVEADISVSNVNGGSTAFMFSVEIDGAIYSHQIVNVLNSNLNQSYNFPSSSFTLLWDPSGIAPAYPEFVSGKSVKFGFLLGNGEFAAVPSNVIHTVTIQQLAFKMQLPIVCYALTVLGNSMLSGNVTTNTLDVQDVSGSRDLNFNRHVNFPSLSSGELSGRFVSIQPDGELTTTTLDVDEVSRVTTKVNNASANWDSTYTDVSETSANWDSVYASVTATSADWNSVYSYVSGTSATNNLEFNDTRFVNITGDTMTGDLNMGSEKLIAKRIQTGDDTKILTLLGGSDSSDGAQILLAGANHSTSSIRNRVQINADNVIIGDVLAGDYKPWVLHVDVDSKQVIIGGLTPLNNSDISLYGHTTVSGDMLPDSDVDFDLGSNSHQWNTLFTQDISASNAVSASNLIVTGDSTTGNLTTNEFSVGHVDSDLIPKQNMSKDMGTPGKHWMNIYTHNLSAHGNIYTHALTAHGDITSTGDTMTGTLNIQDTLSAVGSVTFDSDLLVQGDLRVDGDVWFNANNTGGTNTIHMGDDNTDNIVFSADIDSNIIPNQDLVFDLGSMSQRWNELFVKDISANGDTNVHDLSITGEIRNPSSVWSPSDLPDIDLISWHDAADVSTINLNGNTSIVTSIDDKSTNSYNLTKEGTGVDITTGSTVNSLNSVSAVEGASLTNSSVPLPEDHAFYIVAQVDTTDDGSDSLLSVKTGNSWQLDAAGASIFEARLLTTGIGFDATTHKLAPGGGLNNQLALFRLTFNGSTDTVTGGLNGLNKFTQASYIDKQSPAEIRLFGNRSNSMFPDGIFSEMLIVSDVTQSTQDKIEGYLAHKWGLTLDSAHTYASATPTNTTPPVVVASSLSWPGGDSTQSNDTSMVVQANSAAWVNQPTVHTMTRSSLQITTPYGPTGELVSWTPTYSTGLNGWWDASDSTTITLDASNNITSWDDLAGSNNLTGQNDPQISSTLHNSLSVIDFDVENEHFISSTNSITLPTDGDVQFFIVCEPIGIDDAFDAILSYRGTASDLDFQIDAGVQTGFKGVLRTRGLETGLGATSTAIPGNPTTGMNMFNAVFDHTGSEYSFRINSTLQGTAKTYDNKLAPSGTLGVFINRGGAEFPTGKVAEVLMTSDITENNRQTIEGYLAHKWNLTDKLPSGHPFKNTAPTNSVESYNPEFLAMQSDSSASDSKWADINYEHAMVLPYDATVKRVVLRGASTQGATVNVSVYSNRSETNANDVNFKFFPNTPVETTSQTFTTNNEGRLYTFSNTTSASMGRTLGISLSADQVIGHTNATIVLQYDT